MCDTTFVVQESFWKRPYLSLSSMRAETIQ
nr:MAG TPA: hypothetical protein [Caudoviricetes sp.]DAS16131.1 MAG TPA: hypothetical protein [Caudoviricetes sp.]